MADSQQFDSSELPSLGRVARRPELTEEEIRKEARREWGIWILGKIRVGIAQNPNIQELERIVDRQQQALDKASQTILRLEQKITKIEGQLKAIEARNKELGNKEAQILSHVASVDEKASEIDRISHVAFGIYEIIEDWLPWLKTIGSGMAKRAAHLEELRTHAKSYSDGKDIDELIPERDRRRRTRFRS